MTTPSVSFLTLVAIQAALSAGDILRRGFGTLYTVNTKPGRQNFVTQYDHASEASILSVIKANFPTHSILAEESGSSKSSHLDEVLWIIDPLDGTNNFAHHLPFFTISIAAYQKEEAICGVIYQPLTQELFVAEKGGGAYLNGKRLSISQTNSLENALVIGSLPYEEKPEPMLNLEHLLAFNQEGAILRNFGSAALGLAYLAAGKVDAFWMYNLYPWDWAAGKLLVEEAGGLIDLQTKIPSSPFSNPTFVLATNRLLYYSLKETLFELN